MRCSRPLGQLFSMLPGFSAQFIEKGKEKVGQAKIKRYMTIMESMTDAELGSTNPKLMNESRITRIARGSGRLVRDVLDMLEEYKRIAKMRSKLCIPNTRQNTNRDSFIMPFVNAIPAKVLSQLGGEAALKSLMKQMGSKGMS